MEKPIKTKPIFFSYCFAELQKIAVDHGYNLLIHGSLNRDLDLVCVAWTDNPKCRIELLDAFSDYLGCLHNRSSLGYMKSYNHSVLPGGRDSHIIYLNYGFDQLGKHTEDQWYLDISFTPQIKNYGTN
ncbi:hypothetical protein C7S20_00055 [Christiangramia fulva]|uniref:Uncharacterized protein n=1 Tax=Christiangramia fulva TaxID=2126553 RepID=A0A2R3Z0J9_9FLAO|nr:hypothetical protein [Christiangramia fulva]AVR43791.1 hypothetical protein C7S20_00055 [Christiangramia fulva]